MRWRRRLLDLGLAAFALLTVLPLAWMVSVSLMPKGEAGRFPPPLLPSRVTFDNYLRLVAPRTGDLFTSGYDLMPAVWNSVALALLATLFGLLFTIPAGFAFAKLRFTGRARLLQALVALLVVPGQVAMLPLFLMLRAANLVNTYPGVLAHDLAGLYAIAFTRAAALSIPDAMLDAARIDGAGEVRIFLRIVLPLLTPVVVTLGLFAFLTSWGDFLWPLIVLTDRNSYTLPVALAAMSREHSQDVELMMAGAVFSTVPVLLIFLSLQRFYFSGILGGGVKG